MKLLYHQGNNFGDAINPIIFDYYLGDSFEKREDIAVIGIGSIIAFFHEADYSKKYIFSSGIALGQDSTYGTFEKLQDDCEVICVRGPLTAKTLGIDASLAITDGAILLKEIFPEPKVKKYKVSYMPHIGSLIFFPGLKSLLSDMNIHMIDPRDDVKFVIDEIKSSEKLITEALHGAIVADSFRVPWKQVRMYDTINEFKWRDYHLSMSLEFKPTLLPSLYSKIVVSRVLKDKIGVIGILFRLPYLIYQKIIKVGQFKSKLRMLSNSEIDFMLSENAIFDQKLHDMKKQILNLKEKVKK